MSTSTPIRAPGVVVRALTLDHYAYTLLREMAPTTKSYGQFLSALVLAEYARRQERQHRLRPEQLDVHFVNPTPVYWSGDNV
jgi:hypothetical protein